jgi:hypothetical protein
MRTQPRVSSRTCHAFKLYSRFYLTNVSEKVGRIFLLVVIAVVGLFCLQQKSDCLRVRKLSLASPKSFLIRKTFWGSNVSTPILYMSQTAKYVEKVDGSYGDISSRELRALGMIVITKAYSILDRHSIGGECIQFAMQLCNVKNIMHKHSQLCISCGAHILKVHSTHKW